MEIVNNTALRLMLRNPHRVTETIPRSAVVAERDGVYETLVYWGLEEAQVLKNLGIRNVPSPISKNYDWPGVYSPFAHQRATAEFLTMHRRAYCFNEQGCVDSETEYLSPTGWVKISEYTGGAVAQYWPDTERIEFVNPTEYVKLPCNDMVRIKSTYGVDQLLSLEHRVLVQDVKALYEGRVKHETLSAVELLRRHDNYHSGIPHIPSGPKKLGTKTIAFSNMGMPSTFNTPGGTGLDITLSELRVQVAVIADGYFRRDTNKCIIRIKKERKNTRLRQLLADANIPYVESQDTSVSGLGFTIFRFDAPRRDKVFTGYYWNANRQELEVIFDEVQHWDSCIVRGFRFSTYKKESADFIQYVASGTGHTARLLVNHRERRGKVETEYVVQIRDTKLLCFRNPAAKTVTLDVSTDGHKYCFSVPSTYLVFRRNGCVFVSGNTGKSAAVAWASDYLLNRNIIKRVLIVCPLSIMESAWRDDLFKTVMHRAVDVAHGTRTKRVSVVNSSAEYVIINFDGLEAVETEISNGGFDLIVVDEANAYKSASTKRWKTLNRILKPTTWMWMLTGTPASQSPTDAYGLAKLMHPSSAPPSFTSFQQQVMWKITTYKWVPKDDAAEQVNALLQPAIRFTKKECLDLPELLYVSRYIPLTPQQEKFYKELKSQMLIDASGLSVSAVNKAVLLNKLIQISSGAVYAEDRSVLEFDISNRYNELLNVLAEAKNKTIVFVPFRHTIEYLQEHLRKDKFSVETIDGSVPVGKRTDIFRQFQTTDNPQILLIQPQAAAHGVTLHRADTVVWWGPVASVETWLQANARVHRAGQKNACLVVKLWGSPVEKHVYQILESGEDMQTALLGMYKGENI